jgi:DNA-binding transcriptional MerR regulator
VGGCYKIGTVAKLTGIDVMTLRNWERRYGVIVAARGNGRQRAYSTQDLDRLHWIKDKLDAGLSAGEAHALLREQLKRARTDLTGPRIRAEARRVRASAAETRQRIEQARTAPARAT